MLERALDGELEQPFDVGVADRLSEAYERLGRLSIPAGEHPFLDEIVSTLEAMEALLVCISLVRSAARAFSASPRRPRRSQTTQLKTLSIRKIWLSRTYRGTM